MRRTGQCHDATSLQPLWTITLSKLFVRKEVKLLLYIRGVKLVSLGWT